MSIWWKSILWRMTMAFMEDAYYVGWGTDHPEETISIWQQCYYDGKSHEMWLPVSIYAVWRQGTVDDIYADMMFQLDDAGVPRHRECKECRSFYDDSEYGDYGEVYSYCPRCYRFPRYDNLKTFPFKNAPEKCFIPNFWLTKYSSTWEPEGPRRDAAWAAYYKKYPMEAKP